MSAPSYCRTMTDPSKPLPLEDVHRATADTATHHVGTCWCRAVVDDERPTSWRELEIEPGRTARATWDTRAPAAPSRPARSALPCNGHTQQLRSERCRLRDQAAACAVKAVPIPKSELRGGVASQVPPTCVAAHPHSEVGRADGGVARVSPRS